jgi:palmitoyltransferase
VDAQQMAIIGIAFLFAFFTASLLASHTRLILLNMTTIEDMAAGRIRSRERAALTRTFGFFGWRSAYALCAFESYIDISKDV